MKNEVFEMPAIDLLASHVKTNLVTLDPPYKEWDEDLVRHDLLTNSWNSLVNNSFLICFCNPTAPDNKGKRRHDFIIETAVSLGFKFKYEFFWIKGIPASRFNHPGNKNTRILVFAKGNPVFNKFCMEHTEKSIKTRVHPDRLCAGGTFIASKKFEPNENGRTISDVLEYAEDDMHDSAFYENLKRSDSVNIGGTGIESKRIQSKPPGLMRTLIKAFSNKGDVIVDPFAGSGTTGDIAKELERSCIMGDIDMKCVNYIKLKN
jgi:DNA modification methylase